MRNSVNRRDFIIHSAAVGASLSHYRALRAAEGQSGSRRGVAFNPISYSNTKLTKSFWADKQEVISAKTVKHIIDQIERKSGRLRNFEKAARRAGELHEGFYFDDSDVYKAVEAIAYCLDYRATPEVEETADRWIDTIAAAQLPDGYLNTYFTLTDLDKRWTDTGYHEDFCAGHLVEAAIAYYEVTGKRKLLDVAIKCADNIDATFRVGNRRWVSGHEEIELALVKLWRLTGGDNYLKLAEWYVEQRGHGNDNSALWSGQIDREYAQDDLPVRQQREIKGHAVRAMYLYSGVTDIACVTRDADYLTTLRAVWEDAVYQKMYITGGIGSTDRNEGFGQKYDLPNAVAYCETCAAVGMVMWNHRMSSLTGDSRYVDVLERSLYNGALSGISLRGDKFFYTNPLTNSASFPQRLGLGRQEWFVVACCPTNITRLIGSIGGYVYGVSSNAIWVNLFVASRSQVVLGNTRIVVRMDTDYPWSGDIRITLEPEQPRRYTLRVRVPGWARNVAVPGDLYRFADTNTNEPTLRVNGRLAHYSEENGYLVVDRHWSKGDIVDFSLPMPIRTVVARSELGADRDRIALQRGPLVYCTEAEDNGGSAWNFVAAEHARLRSEPGHIDGEPIIEIHREVAVLEPTADRTGAQIRQATIKAIPYYTWANRECYDMQVWLPTRIDRLKIDA